VPLNHHATTTCKRYRSRQIHLICAPQLLGALGPLAAPIGGSCTAPTRQSGLPGYRHLQITLRAGRRGVLLAAHPRLR